jgi:hypothetical protein
MSESLEDLPDMPNPFNRVIPDAHIYLDTSILDNKPAMASLVVKIFAVWANIERELSFLLVRLLGADAKPALAMFETLTAQHLQLGALDAAAQADLPSEAYDIFLAVTSAADTAQTPRNHLAHWAWGGCHQKPELLALVDPKKLKESNLRHAHIELAIFKGRLLEIDGYFPEWIDPKDALAYSENDLARALRDLNEANDSLALLASYLATIPLDWGKDGALEIRRCERDELLGQLNERRLFREALARKRANQKSTLPEPNGSHPRGSGE